MEDKPIEQIAKEAREWAESEEGQAAIASSFSKARKLLAELDRPSHLPLSKW